MQLWEKKQKKQKQKQKKNWNGLSRPTSGCWTDDSSNRQGKCGHAASPAHNKSNARDQQAKASQVN